MNQMTKRVLLRSEIVSKLNFASHQNSYSVLRELSLHHNGEDETLENIKVTIEANPPFFKPKTWHFDALSPDSIVSVKDRDLLLDGAFLLNLADKMRGTITIKAECSGTLLVEENTHVELLAYNEWGGAGFMPELLAAFVTPNDPAIDQILKRASQVLKAAGKSDGIDGYQSGSRERVWELASSIYSAIAQLGLSYAEPPASFERNGQKIRLPSSILQGGLGTCLDTTLLFAASLEQAGLNPVIALPNGHAMVGVWLQPEELSSVVLDEAESLRKRVQLQELLLIETTFATTHPAPPFSKAVKTAVDKIPPERDWSFVAAIDVRRARSHRINPLGLKLSSNTEPEADGYSSVIELGLEAAPSLPKFDMGIELEAEIETPGGRLDRWQRRLLDLTLNNRLLNHRAAKTSLEIICPDPGALEDKLAEGAKISIQHVPRSSSDAQDEELHLQRTGEVITNEYAEEILRKNQVLVDLPEDELAKRAIDIFRKTQTSLQEGGANTLYLALGFLLWKKDTKDDRRFRAPLILLPVSLERKSARSGIKMSSHDDEPRFNTTLLEMLRKDFGLEIKGLDDELPTDHSGIDVSGIWNKIRLAVKEAPGFEVVEDVVLGHFSFAKYLMWKDLVDRTDQLKENPVVAHLIDNPKASYANDIDFVVPSDLDQTFKTTDLIVPLPADSSQIAAIAAAERGKDFVIFGPPGTGKSQTIANLITHLLAKDKTILFVSEKTAALEVVSRRLKQIGLGDFYLELHSSKSRKVDVLNQLRSAWESGQEKAEDEWQIIASEIGFLRQRLNLIVSHLHKKHRNGLTPFYAMGVAIRDRLLAERVILSWPKADHHDVETLKSMRGAVDNLAIQANAVGKVLDSPFEIIGDGTWSPQWQSEIALRARRLSMLVAKVEQSCDVFCSAVGIEPLVQDRTFSRLDALVELAKFLQDSYRKQTAFALEVNGSERVEALEKAVCHLRVYIEAQAKLSCPYDVEAWRNIDGNDVELRWREANEAWWPKSFFARGTIVRELRQFGARGKPDPQSDALLLKTLRSEGLAIDQLDGVLAGLRIWNKHTTNPDQAEDIAHLGYRCRDAVTKLADNADSLMSIKGVLRRLMDEGNEFLAPDSAVGKVADILCKDVQSLKEGFISFAELSSRDIQNDLMQAEVELADLRQKADAVVEKESELREWCAWRKARTAAIDAELLPLVDALERGSIAANDLADVFEAAYCKWWSGAVLTEDTVLRDFSSAEHVALIEKFRSFDDRFLKVTAEYVAAKLRQSLPSQQNITRGSEWGVLQRELQKQRMHKPVRQLMEEIPEVITSLTPCLMMSPLSIAQYLPANQSLFDVVIFDEASQITVWDAVGALARGKQVIVAGDPKQMPPSNFFGRSDDDPDGEVEEDLESILDEMIGASIAHVKLNWHYRSRQESLIAFSNHRYYDDSLVTFPSPAVEDRGVRLINVDGFYARGGGRHNEAEAKEIVAECVRRLTHKDEDIRLQSLGVVTFNSEQQTLIMNLLDAARIEQPEIEWAFSSESVEEPVFVKNLETVQGDERDVILFSVTYGPDRAGHVSMNFGPLNRSGGERRLNVAMTRARHEMLVFSTLTADKIDLSRTQSRAVTDLKHFLEYAEKGAHALGAAVMGSVGDFESPFEVAVARALRYRGWDVHPQIGVSAYRIDLGVVHPDSPGVYLAGIECDGATYHSSYTARDRDKLRQSVLEGLGWSLVRIWSTDWWANWQKALDTVIEKLNQILELDRAETAEREAKTTELLQAKELEDRTDLPDLDAEVLVTSSPILSAFKNTEKDLEYSEFAEGKNSEYTEYSVRENLISIIVNQTSYQYAEFDKTDLVAKPDAFYEDHYRPTISKMIAHVVAIEGPVHEDILVRRIARHHGFNRAGRQIKSIILELARCHECHIQENVGTFFLPTNSEGEAYCPARHAGRNAEMRQVDYICDKEILGIAKSCGDLRDAIEVARTLGIARLNNAAKLRIEDALLSLSESQNLC